MKLLSRSEAQSSKKKENERLIESNIKLRSFYHDFTARIQDAKKDYGAERVKALEDFEKFVKEINEKKSKLLKELVQVQKLLEEKKEAYYALVEKQDDLEEREYNLQEKEKKIELRENFIKELEEKWITKTSTT